MKCTKCDGYGIIDLFTPNVEKCDRCNGTGKIKRKYQTNDEWRKTCSTEEFAEWIYNLIMHEGNTEWYEDLLDYREDTMDYRADYHLIEKWLKEKHNE